MAIKFKTAQSGQNSLNQLLQVMNTISNIEERKEENKRAKNIESLNTINKGVNDASDIDSIDNLVNLLNINSPDYNSNTTTLTVSENLKNKARIKKEKINYYHETINDMANNYLGTNDFKGYQNLDKNDFAEFTYESVSNELAKIKDFERIFEDETYNVHSYNNSQINTIQLKDRISSYKQKLMAGLEATKDNNLVDDNELVYIITGDSAGLKSAKTNNLKSLNKQKLNNNRAMASIRKNIASMKAWMIKQVDQGGSPIKFADSVDWGLLNIGAMNDYYTKMYESNPEFQDEELENFITRKFKEDSLKNPKSLLFSWQNEIQGYEGLNKIVDLEIKKWGGTDVTGFNTPYDTELLEKDMRKSLGLDISGAKVPKAEEDIPIDLQSTDDGNSYFSPSENKFYDKNAVNNLLGI
tara:strand:- start:7531 stop:8766 length:1236 start_codon:yes stop_codon:yes gene_type:complete